MKLRITPRAGNDLESIFDYLVVRNPRASGRVIEAIHGALQLIAAHPRAGRKQQRGVRRLTMQRFPYLIFYRVDNAADEVAIITIRHAAREPERS